MNVYTHLLYFLSDLDEILYKWFAQSAAHNLRGGYAKIDSGKALHFTTSEMK
jgi:hypothetical protein